jgi:hypothetical protein
MLLFCITAIFDFDMPSAQLLFAHLTWLVAWFSCLPCRTWCSIIIIIFIINCTVCILALAAAMHVSTARAIFVSCGHRSFCQETAPIAHFCQPVVAEITPFYKRKAQFWGQNSALSGQPKPCGTTLLRTIFILSSTAQVVFQKLDCGLEECLPGPCHPGLYAGLNLCYFFVQRFADEQSTLQSTHNLV